MPRGTVSIFGTAILFGVLAWSSLVLSEEVLIPQIEADRAEQQEAPVSPNEAGRAEQQEALAPQIEIDRAEQQVFGSNPSLWNRIKVITKQFHPSLQKAVRARIMYLYRLDDMDNVNRLRTLFYLLLDNQNEPPVFLIRTEDADVEGDFVGKPVWVRLPDEKSDKKDAIFAAIKAYSTDNTWNDFQTTLIKTISDKDDVLKGPLYLATERHLPWIDPASSVVFFDFDPKFASDQPPLPNSGKD